MIQQKTKYSCPVCTGNILASYSLRKGKVSATFSCGTCGVLIKPTEANKITVGPAVIISRIITNYVVLKLKTHIHKHSFLFCEGKDREKLNKENQYLYKRTPRIVGMEIENPYLVLSPDKKVTLWWHSDSIKNQREEKRKIIKDQIQPFLDSNKIEKAREKAYELNADIYEKKDPFIIEDILAKKKLPSKNGADYKIKYGYIQSEVEIPKNAQEAIKVYVMENDFSLSSYWIPRSKLK